MRGMLSVIFAGFLILQVVEPPELPPGEFCSHIENGNKPAHPCACHRECVDQHGEDEDGTQTTGTVVKEDAQCKQYCHKEHCHCPVHNCD
jgi:hypothetical protein